MLILIAVAFMFYALSRSRAPLDNNTATTYARPGRSIAGILAVILGLWLIFGHGHDGAARRVFEHVGRHVL